MKFFEHDVDKCKSIRLPLIEILAIWKKYHF